jgi:hypothetical protein
MSKCKADAECPPLLIKQEVGPPEYDQFRTKKEKWRSPCAQGPSYSNIGRLCRARHNPELGIMQSIFSPAARRKTLRVGANFDRRDGELKMDWTKPLARCPPLWVLNGWKRSGRRQTTRWQTTNVQRCGGGATIPLAGEVEKPGCQRRNMRSGVTEDGASLQSW